MNLRVPMTGSDFTGAVGEVLDRPGDAAGNPPTEDQTDKESGDADQSSDLPDLADEDDKISVGTSDQEDAQEFIVSAFQWNSVKGFGVGSVTGPIDGANEILLRLLLNLLDEWLKRVGLGGD